MKTVAYVDGFNLYYGALKDTPFRWLDIHALLQRLLPSAEITGIKYFTARVKPKPDDADQPVRQQMFLRALSTIPIVRIYYGFFRSHQDSLPLVHPQAKGERFVKVWRTSEKGSDVNLACQLLNDAHRGRFEQALVLSGDSDLVMPIEIVIKEISLPVCVINPRRKPADLLRNCATFYRHILKSTLKAAQFPESLRDRAGEFRKPRGW